MQTLVTEDDIQIEYLRVVSGEFNGRSIQAWPDISTGHGILRHSGERDGLSSAGGVPTPVRVVN